MTTKATQEAADLLKQVLKETEAAKGSVAAAVRMLLRAAKIVGDADTQMWCEIQLGEPRYAEFLSELLEKWLASQQEPENNDLKTQLDAAFVEVERAGIKLN